MSAKVILTHDWQPVTVELKFHTRDQLIAFVAFYDQPDSSSCFIEHRLPRARAYNAIDQTIDQHTLTHLWELTR